MDKSALARTGIAGAVAGLGLTAGGIALANADTEKPDTSSSSSAHPGGPRAGHGGWGQRAQIIAEALGLDEDVVSTALQEVHDELRPERSNSTERTPPTDADRAEHQAALAAALAKKLDVSEAEVTAALEKVREQADADREERRTETRTALVERLDAAVTEGTLTESDKASVLKAYDAGLLGMGIGGGHGRPGLHPGMRGGPGGGMDRDGGADPATPPSAHSSEQGNYQSS
ncbi:MAG: hypothetical protein HZY75_10685 [Nocardioidaceae bacterium]|nr:MAG: hypothetical protein HZY75_10685 [Nocardioidaceae bacterium]